MWFLGPDEMPFAVIACLHVGCVYDVFGITPSQEVLDTFILYLGPVRMCKDV